MEVAAPRCPSTPCDHPHMRDATSIIYDLSKQQPALIGHAIILTCIRDRTLSILTKSYAATRCIGTMLVLERKPRRCIFDQDTTYYTKGLKCSFYLGPRAVSKFM